MSLGRRANFPVESAAGGASRRGRPGLDLRARQSASHAPPTEHRRRRPAHRDREWHTTIVFLRRDREAHHLPGGHGSLSDRQRVVVRRILTRAPQRARPAVVSAHQRSTALVDRRQQRAPERQWRRWSVGPIGPIATLPTHPIGGWSHTRPDRLRKPVPRVTNAGNSTVRTPYTFCWFLRRISCLGDVYA